MLPQLQRDNGLVLVAGDVALVLRVDVEALAVADVVAQIVGVLDERGRLVPRIQSQVRNAELGIGHGKLRIDFDGLLVVSGEWYAE
jgi:hypothetical protein